MYATGMNRYLRFVGRGYYPLGGWRDFMDSFTSLEEARGATIPKYEYGILPDWAHIIDSRTGKTVLVWDAVLPEWMPEDEHKIARAEKFELIVAERRRTRGRGL